MTELAIRDTAEIKTFGSRDDIAAIRDRIMTMIPGAAEAPQDVVWAAAQLAVAHDLDPFNGEIYIIKLGRKKVGNDWVDDYRAHIGVKGLRKKARRQAKYMAQFRTMEAAEVKALRRGEYDPGDIGVECTLYRLDVARECKSIGIPYIPTVAIGLWRQRAQYHSKKKEWMPDNIPNTWTAEQVAKKRAEINAIKEAFDVDFAVADPAQVDDDDVVEVVGRQVKNHDQQRALFAERPIHREANGDILFPDGGQAGAEEYEEGEWEDTNSDSIRATGDIAEEELERMVDDASLFDDVDEDPTFAVPALDRDTANMLSRLADSGEGAKWEKARGYIKQLRDAHHGTQVGPASPEQMPHLLDTLDRYGDPASLLWALYGTSEPSYEAAALLLSKIGDESKIVQVWDGMVKFVAGEVEAAVEPVVA